MLYRLKKGKGTSSFEAMPERRAKDLGVAEKDLETWLAQNPELLFRAERVLVIGQSVSGESMADILALDADGSVILVEMKRDWSDRGTVGQLLEYAAKMARSTYDELERIARRYWADTGANLLEKLRSFFEAPTFEKEGIGRRQRLVIVAPQSDANLRDIVAWLRSGGVAIDFVPFTLRADSSGDMLVEIEALQASVEAPADWKGDWFFNTNETHAPGAFRKMFQQGVIAVCGYANDGENLTGSRKGDRVFAYTNRLGILAVGRIVDETPFPAATVYGRDREFHVRVDWKTVVADDRGVTSEQSRERGYNLPVRSVFCRMGRHDVANWIAEELARRK